MVDKLISGGQTGVDRAALDVALAMGIPCGGWCPQGRRAVDGEIPAKYPLKETKAQNYNKRTKLNVQDADGTLILHQGELSGGTAYTAYLAEKMGKSHLVVDLAQSSNPQDMVDWLEQQGIRVLNIAGPREDKCPGIHEQVSRFLRNVLT